ncbi:MAG: glycosyltransferase [Oscillospiraceae bacterium]|nr:glycosyltransferase [Oscillospiraceae bacterium]
MTTETVMWIADLILDFINVFFVVYLIGYSTFLFLSVTVGSSELFKKKRQYRMMNAIQNNYYIPISIIVPAYNEEVTVTSTVKSLLALDYKVYEIIVVDDGSKDNTAKVMIDEFHMAPVRMPIHRQLRCQEEMFIYSAKIRNVNVTLISKKNGGKADALNMGINASRFPYFICIDADSVLQFDSLKKIALPLLENENVVAVGGSVRPSNGAKIENGHVVSYKMPKNLLASMQTLEYDRSFLASRILLDKFNGALIISGAFGLFQKKLVIEAGGYDANTMGEDMELVVKLHEYCMANDIPYLIKYATDAICWSQAPEKLRDLMKQRRRWHIGLFQSLWMHRHLAANPKYGPVSFISYTYFLFYELLSPYIEVFGLLSVALAIFLDMLNVRFALLFLGIYAAFGAIMSLTSFFARTQTLDLKLSFGDVLKAVGLCFFEVTILRSILAYTRFFSLLGYRKKKRSWGKIERKKIDLR